MDDAFAFYGGAGAGLEDVVVKDSWITATLRLWSWGTGRYPAARHVRFGT